MAKLLDVYEGWVLDNLHLTTDEAYKQETVNLSGTYTERIRSLGRSLLSFHNLLSLNLSRNMLHSLKGLDHLTQLRCLNLYFNDISTIKELYRLRSNKQLREVDVRLNPVTKEEPHFRFFLVYMLPHLRELDDSDVYEQERGAAILHFSSDQAHNFSFESPKDYERSYEMINTSGYQTHPRIKMVQKAFPLTHSALDDDDVTLLDLLSKSHFDASTRTISSKLVGNSFTEIEERICSRFDVNSNLGQLFGRFVKEITNVLRCHLSEKEKVCFVEDFNNLVENEFVEFSKKDEEITRKEKDWKREFTSLEERLEATEAINREHQDKLREILNENSNLRIVKNELSPLKTALSQVKEENLLLQEKINIQENHIDDMNGRMLSKDTDRILLEKSMEDKRTQFEESCTSLKEIRGLAAMLQETHQLLVTNNNALLQVNFEMKEKHEQEINQLHLSYQQLRKSIDVWRETNKQNS